MCACNRSLSLLLTSSPTSALSMRPENISVGIVMTEIQVGVRSTWGVRDSCHPPQFANSCWPMVSTHDFVDIGNRDVLKPPGQLLRVEVRQPSVCHRRAD